MLHCENIATPYPLSSTDGRVHVTVYPGRPAYLCVTHAEVSEGEFDAILLELAMQIPAPCCVVMVPAMMQTHCSPQRKEQRR